MARRVESVQAVERRFLLLQGLRWLPVGFIAPLLILILTRDLSLGRAGLLMAIYSVTTVVLELPTGGLADSIGRRPVLMASSLASLAFFALLAISTSFLAAVVAMFIAGVGRALDSGPLESWFVDQSQRIQPDVDLRHGLSLAGAVDGTALAVGAVVGGALPQWFGSRLEAAVVAALVFQALHLVAVALFLVENPNQDLGVGEPPGTSDDGRRRTPLASAVAALSSSLSSLSRRVGKQRELRRLLLGSLTIGVGLVAVEMLWQPRFVAVLGGGDDPADANTVFLGLLLAAAFAGGAVGSGAAPRLAVGLSRWTSASATVAQLLGACCLAAMALVEWAPLAAVFFVGFYTFNAAAGPLRDELLHQQVLADTRSSAVSADSLAFQGGGFLAALTLPALAEVAGVPAAWILGAVVLAAGALAYVGIERLSVPT